MVQTGEIDGLMASKWRRGKEVSLPVCRRGAEHAAETAKKKRHVFVYAFTQSWMLVIQVEGRVTEL